MGVILEWSVWFSLALVAYTYLGYPLLLVALDAGRQLRGNLARLQRGLDRRSAREPTLPPQVSLVVAAHDEAGVIRQKIENCLALDYPADRLEILIGSDGSTDGTDDLVRSFSDRGVVLSSAPRCGKAGVLNRLIPQARGEVIVLSDANTFLAPDAVRRLVARLESPEVGAVCGQLRLQPARATGAGTARESAYWTYESALKLYEGKLGCLVGANGGIYAIRRRLFEALPAGTITDDFVIPLRLLGRGYEVVYESAAVAVEEAPERVADEFRRRARIGAGNFQSLPLLRALWQGPRPYAALAFISHKLLRWLTPFFMASAFAASVLCFRHPLCRVALLGQLAFYAAAIWGGFGRRNGAISRGCQLAHYFVSMNLALAIGALRHLRRSQGAAWDRTPRGLGEERGVA